MERNGFLALAKENNWSRKQARNELFKLGEPLWSARDEILVALGFAPTQAETAAATPIAELPKAPARRGNMVLKYAADDCLTGRRLEPGMNVTGVKVGGGWDFTAEPISGGDLRKLREAMLLSLDPAQGGPDCELDLDHEDYAILAEFGRKYPRVAGSIGVDVPGLED